jgi:protein disulfide-isomerase A1
MNFFKPLSAKMDATTNDIPPSAQFHVSGFPTIKFKPAGTRDFIDYEGDRSLESLVEFITKHAKNPLDPETPFKGSSTSTKVEPPKQTEHVDEHAQKHVEL